MLSWLPHISPNCSPGLLEVPREEDVEGGSGVRKASRGHRALPPPAQSWSSAEFASVREKVSGLCIWLFLINLIMFKFNKECMNLRVFLSAQL